MRNSEHCATWDEVELGEIVTLHRGYDLPAADRRDGSIPVVSSSGITGYHDEAKVRPPGVVTGRYGTLGEVFFLEEPYWPLNTTLFVSDFHGNDERFVSYFLRCAGLGAHDGAAAVPGINRNVLHRLPANRPPLLVQRKIAAILSAYDALIENNNRRIKILEEMAQRIYREWFVDFRYPGHEDVPLVDSELGLIPREWTVEMLATVCNVMQSGGTPRRSNDAYWEGGTIDWYKTTELRDNFLETSLERVTPAALAERKTRLFPADTILMAIYGSPTVGRMGILNAPGSCNQAALAIRADEARVPQTLLYYMLIELRRHFNAIAQGAAQQNISKEKVAATKVVCPPRSITTRWRETIDANWQQRRNLAARLSNLRATRDLLLPRLVSGEIDVTDLDVAVRGLAA